MSLYFWSATIKRIQDSPALAVGVLDCIDAYQLNAVQYSGKSLQARFSRIRSSAQLHMLHSEICIFASARPCLLQNAETYGHI